MVDGEEEDVEAALINPGSTQIMCPMLNGDEANDNVVMEIVLVSVHMQVVSFTD